MSQQPILPVKKGSRKNFRDKFGKLVEEYTSIQNAMEGKSEETKKHYITRLPNYF